MKFLQKLSLATLTKLFADKSSIKQKPASLKKKDIKFLPKVNIEIPKQFTKKTGLSVKLRFIKQKNKKMSENF